MVNKPKYYEAYGQNKNTICIRHVIDEHITFWRASKTFVRTVMINLQRIKTQWAKLCPTDKFELRCHGNSGHPYDGCAEYNFDQQIFKHPKENAIHY